MSTVTWGKLLRDEAAALERLAPGDTDLQELAGASAITIFNCPVKRVRALVGFSNNPQVHAMGVEFVEMLRSAANAHVL